MTLMVILGAGASYDSSPDDPVSGGRPGQRPYRPPLGNDLFVDRDDFRESRERFPQFHELIPELLPNLGGAVEEALQRLQDEIPRDPRRWPQLTAVRYYLKSIFELLSVRWLGNLNNVTNYLALIGQIQHYRAERHEPVCLVTFNYDTLIEGALVRHGFGPFHEMTHYVSGEFKLFKLHGSHNWGRIIEGALPDDIGLPSPAAAPFRREHAIIQRAANLNVTDQFDVMGLARSFNGPVYPAIAIPVLNKDVFECPTNHVDRLRAQIPQVTHVIAIGWRATELHFLRMLNDLRAVSIATVAGTDREATDVLERIRAAAPSAPFGERASFAGFSDTIGQRRLDRFLGP